MTVGCRNRSAQLRLALEGVLRVNEYFAVANSLSPSVYGEWLRGCAQARQCGRERCFRIPGRALPQVQMTLLAGVTPNAVKHLFVISHRAGVPHVGNGAQDLARAATLPSHEVGLTGLHFTCERRKPYSFPRHYPERLKSLGVPVEKCHGSCLPSFHPSPLAWR